MGAFVPTPGEIAQALDAVGKLVDLIKAPEKANKLEKWAELLRTEPKDDAEKDALAKGRMKFLQDRMQDCGFTPWYEWRIHVAIPKDLLCDLGDLLIGGPVTSTSTSLLGGIVDMFRGLIGKVTVKPDEKQVWAATTAYGKDEDIVKALKDIVVSCGRVRYYDKDDTLEAVDKSLIADAGMWLLNTK